MGTPEIDQRVGVHGDVESTLPIGVVENPQGVWLNAEVADPDQDIVGLSDRAKHTPSELSGGQEQRVAIARAIVSDPTLLLCDEPTGDLDRETADEILKLLQVLNREHGKTIVMVTHDAQAAEYANRTLHCDKGTLEAREAA